MAARRRVMWTYLRAWRPEETYTGKDCGALQCTVQHMHMRMHVHMCMHMHMHMHMHMYMYMLHM